MMEATTGFCDNLENYACKFTPTNLNVPYQNFKDTWRKSDVVISVSSKAKRRLQLLAVSFAILSSMP